MRCRFSDEELARRLEIYAEEEGNKQGAIKRDPSQPSYFEAMDRLVHAGCDPEILAGLARAHCLAPREITAGLLNPQLETFAKSIDQANTDFWALLDKIGSSFGNSGVQILKILKLERLIPLLATNEWFRDLSELRFQILDKIRIYEPLLCIYVRQVTEKDDYAALAAIYRAFYYASGKSSKSDVGHDAPRMADERYRENHCEAYAALETAVTKYLKDASRALGPPHYVLLLLAHVEMGNLVKDVSAEAKQVA